MEQPNSLQNRRPLGIRRRVWVHKLARFFVQLGVTPNQMSLASIGFAALGAVAYGSSTLTEGFVRAVLFFCAAVFIELRLLSNLLDGIMAVEEGKKTPAGAIYNELPDRVSDSLFLIAAGYAAGSETLGWAAALLAVITAYIRALGGSLGLKQDFCGPMAKQHRMFTLASGSVLAALFPSVPVLAGTLGIIILGSVITALRRTRRLALSLDGKSDVCSQSSD